LTVFVTLVFCAILAVFAALTGWLQGLFRGSPAVRALLVIPGLWGLLEWLRGWVFTGFPWLAVGYSQVPTSPLAGFAPIVGVFGVSVIVCVLAGCVALVFELWRRKAAIARVGALFAVLVVAGFALKLIAWTQPSGRPVTVNLAQGNIAQDIKWQPETALSTLETYRKLVLESQAQLIILPETALPLFLHEVPQDYLDQLAAHAKRNNGDLLVGAPESGGERIYYNSVVSFGASPPQVYRKNHLVPFSEFIPLKPLIYWVYEGLLNMPLADFSRGGADQKPLAVAGQQAAITNCYEDLFGEELIAKLPQATLLVNVSNDGWFGRSLGPQQHLQISQMRALETGRWMLRATNTGVSAFIDERGRVVSRAPEFTLASLQGQAQGFQGATPYVRMGNYAMLAATLLMLGVALGLARRF
jgi:apolipoprotein N-acyltransferase